MQPEHSQPAKAEREFQRMRNQLSDIIGDAIPGGAIRDDRCSERFSESTREPTDNARNDVTVDSTQQLLCTPTGPAPITPTEPATPAAPRTMRAPTMPAQFASERDSLLRAPEPRAAIARDMNARDAPRYCGTPQQQE
eukprot:4072897-Pyramimonas_sp.AAC.1